MNSEICVALLSKDPTVLFLSDTLPSSEEDRHVLVCQILRLYETGGLLDISLIRRVAGQQDGARLTYARIAADIRPYIKGKSKRVLARLAAITLAQLTHQAGLEQDLLKVALDETELYEVRAKAAVGVRAVGSGSSRAALKRNRNDDDHTNPPSPLRPT